MSSACGGGFAGGLARGVRVTLFDFLLGAGSTPAALALVGSSLGDDGRHGCIGFGGRCAGKRSSNGQGNQGGSMGDGFHGVTFYLWTTSGCPDTSENWILAQDRLRSSGRQGK